MREWASSDGFRALFACQAGNAALPNAVPPALRARNGLTPQRIEADVARLLLQGAEMKKTYQKPAFARRQKLSAITAAPALSNGKKPV
ncbi:MAG: hypothetical protein J0I79_06980 [Mesorhizobium sp.]|uniref:hypothetical protein n=1 Tax=Mesorhizobium sp. TaxID=1871066 RepID=UPI001AD351E9|nr:hypothetical protein [Mesorhizobium sp.]MBN9217679.1 hypothetical protein [Mesorhizobium sp.]